MRISDERIKKASAYFNNHLSFEECLKKYRLLDNAVPTSEGVNISCPFHTDKTPSCKINYQKNVYHCFSQGCQGNVIQFMSAYETECLEHRTSYSEVIEKLLKSDRNAQLELGFSSIYEMDYRIEDFTPRKINKFKLKKETPKSWLQLANMIKSKGSMEDRLVAIKLMQEGFDVDYIYSFLFNTKPSVEKSSTFDVAIISKLLEED